MSVPDSFRLEWWVLAGYFIADGEGDCERVVLDAMLARTLFGISGVDAQLMPSRGNGFWDGVGRVGGGAFGPGGLRLPFPLSRPSPRIS